MKEIITRINKTDHPVMQMVKYGLVGVLNTLLTLVVIFVCKTYLDINEYLCNLIGYACGILNSYVFNRTWVFHSHGKVRRESILFFAGCGVCYVVQFIVMWILNNSWFGDLQIDFAFISQYGLGWLYAILKAVALDTVTGYGMATLIGMVAYTICNFIYNRSIAFRAARTPA